MKYLLEVLLFASPKPLTKKRFDQVIESESLADFNMLVDELNAEYEQAGKGLRIRKISGGYQILSLPEYHIFIERLLKNNRSLNLSKPAIEALSIVAYRQPVSKTEVESIRGVECGSVLSTLMDRELIAVKGRSKSLGRALLFGTTQQFLEKFGLENTAALPKLKELSDLMGDIQNPILFDKKYASE